MIRFTLRESLALIVVAALGVAALKMGDGLATVFLSLVAAICLACTIIAFVGINRLRAFSIGFTISSLVYLGMITFSEGRELNPYMAQLPTSKLFRPVYEEFSTTDYRDVVTMELMVDYDPGSPGLSAAGNMISAYNSLDQRTFMWVAHAMMALMLGLVGGKFASAVYYRQHLDVSDSTP